MPSFLVVVDVDLIKVFNFRDKFRRGRGVNLIDVPCHLLLDPSPPERSGSGHSTVADTVMEFYIDTKEIKEKTVAWLQAPTGPNPARQTLRMQSM